MQSSKYLGDTINKLGLSRIGLGAAGPSRLGLSNGSGRVELDRLLGCAASLGINWVDTAGAIGGLDPVLAGAIKSCPEHFCISAKVHVGPDIGLMSNSRLANRLSARLSAETSLVARNRVLIDRVDDLLRTFDREQIDVLWLHAVRPAQFVRLESRLADLIEYLKTTGKIGAFGISESFKYDSSHSMLRRAAASGLLDGAMAAFNPSIPGLPALIDQQAEAQPAWVTMVALRGVLMRTKELLRRSALPLEEYGLEEVSAHELLIRYANHEVQSDFLLFGTGDPDHLEKNVAAAAKGSLPRVFCVTLEEMLATRIHLHDLRTTL